MSVVDARPIGPGHQEMHWGLWLRQALTVMKMELKRYVLGKRWIAI